ncbi:TIGR03663 family protein [Halorussus salilacus]|uniref:flippase activity-associated protein Agl23 n=1 Tax=Halorussus salilacus TaxID=2953750 RepID=UPI00209FCE58|nr:flippase activity-associated protein Agl23 [Halorussus salilacus]USZ68767.1 TIGR03663 family protein [Halorussus salilacus]
MSADETPASVRERLASSETAFGVRTRTAVALVGVTALALSVRLFGLGSRVFHWDEGRVGYWILRYAETGVWEYHAIIHGPFLYHVDKFLFGLVGPSDFVARLPVAVVTGLLPLSAWLFRERLDRTEMVALALFFAFNPVLLYYSRFMRNDALLAALMIFALGFYVRLFDTGRARHLYAGTFALALAFTTKENVLIYVLTWVGAAVLLLDHRFTLRADAGERLALARGYVRSGWTAFRHWSPHLLAALFVFLAVVVFFYAPRARGVSGPGLWKAFSNPAMFPAVLEAGTVGAWEEFASTWAGSHQDHAYIPFLVHYVETLWQGAAPLTLLAGVGFVADRYRGDRPRDLVSFAFYGGFVSIFGYPIATDIQAPWATVHAVVPLAIPAAVGLAIFVRWGLDAIDDEDGVSAVLAAMVVLLVAGQVAVTAADTSFAHPQDQYLDEAGTEENMLVQFGQPADGLRPTLETVEYAIDRNDGTDVLWYGSDFYVADETENDDWAAEGNWYDRLPVPWYTELYGAEVDSTNDLADVESTAAPVVVARADDRAGVESRLDGYRAFEHELTVHGSETVFFVDEEYVERADGADPDGDDE